MRQNLVHVTAKGTFMNVYFKQRTGVGNSNEKEAKSTGGGGGWGGGERTHLGKYQEWCWVAYVTKKLGALPKTLQEQK